MQPPGHLFKDGKRAIDYVLVVDEKNLTGLVAYVSNLEGIGLEMELADGKKTKKKFLLVHIPKKNQDYFGEVYDVGREEGTTKLEIRSLLGRTQTHMPTPDHKEKG
ncbi:hypothetical protein JTB14_007090 [Gonioctena quinquepunctata]|nr:hypothetical protein JTB14_007090 [Gonioctena quinquepunctata]